MTQGKYWRLAPGTNGAPPDTESNMYTTTLAASDMEWQLPPGTNGAPPDTESNMYTTTLSASDMEWLRVNTKDWRRVLMVRRLTLTVICKLQLSLPLTWNDSG